MSRQTKRLEDLSEYEISLINKVNLKLLNDFLEYLEAIDRSSKTIIAYRSSLHIVFNWFRLKADNKSFYEINKRDVSNFQGWCLREKMSPARIRGLKSAMSSLSNYIVKMLDDIYPHFKNIINNIDPPPLSPVRKKTVFSVEEVENLLHTLIETGKIQQACLVAVVCASGMRISELIQVKTSWYRGEDVMITDDGDMYVSPEIRTKGSGSLGKPLEKMTIRELADKYIDLWLEERKRLNIESEYLFVTKRHGIYYPAKESTINSWMQMFTKLTEKDAYCHAFRHFTCTWLVRNGVPLEKVRDFFGHNDSSTTEIYNDIPKSENLNGMLSFMKK